MKNYFASNMKILSNKYTSKYIAQETDFSLSTINKYVSGSCEPSVKFLTKLKEKFDINIEEFLFSDMQVFAENDCPQDNSSRFVGNFICYYYNNASYQGKIHESINELNYGVMSIIIVGQKCKVYCSFYKDKGIAIKRFKEVNFLKTIEEIEDFHKETSNHYVGELKYTQENVFIEMFCKEKDDNPFIIFKNPPSKSDYVGGIATINSISRGREHNPCIQYFLISKKIINRPDGEIYNLLSMKGVDVDLSGIADEIVKLVNNLYLNDDDGLSNCLTNDQKLNLVENTLKYHFDNIIEANEFRYGKISNRDDDEFYQLIKEETDYDD